MDVAVDLYAVELLCSRLCHDLIGPIAAVANGLELIEEGDPRTQQEAVALCQQSAQRASNLLQLFRSAFGSAGGRSACTPAEARKLAAVLAGGRTTLHWPAAAAEANAPRGTGRLMLNLAMLAVEALPRGGSVSVDLAPGSGGLVAVATAEGTGAQLGDEAGAALAPGADIRALSAKSIQAHFAALLARGLGAQLEVSASRPGSVTFSVALSTTG